MSADPHFTRSLHRNRAVYVSLNTNANPTPNPNTNPNPKLILTITLSERNAFLWRPVNYNLAKTCILLPTVQFYGKSESTAQVSQTIIYFEQTILQRKLKMERLHNRFGTLHYNWPMSAHA